MTNTFKMYGSLLKLLQKYIFLPQGTIYLKSERMNTTASSLLKLIGTFAKPWWWRLKYSKPSLRQSILSCLEEKKNLLRRYRVFFFTGPPLKKLKYGKLRLGEVTCSQVPQPTCYWLSSQVKSSQLENLTRLHVSRTS